MFKGKLGKEKEKEDREYPCLAQWDNGKEVFIMSDWCHGVRFISHNPCLITGKREGTYAELELCNSPITLENV